MSRPVLLFHCQHSLGIGHLTRSFALVRALSEHFDVVFLNGGPLPPGIEIPPIVELIHLPALGMDDGHTLVSRDGNVDVEGARRRRVEIVLDALQRCRPQVVLIELFPFGRKKFAFELLPLIRAARAMPAVPRIVCSLRDILVSGRPDQQRHDDRARWLANRYFDAVLVHSDPAFASLDESFRPSRPLRVAVHYTGFVVPLRPGKPGESRAPRILVSAGGGIVGAPLFAAALGAHRRLWPRLGMSMRIVAGPFLPENEWLWLQGEASGIEGLELVRHVPDLTAEMRQSAASVSQCGYNSALDIVQSGVPALVVPYGNDKENEQRDRAERLARLGVVRMLLPGELNADVLAAEIQNLAGFIPAAAAIGLDGAERSAEILQALASAYRVPGRAVGSIRHAEGAIA